MHLITSDKNTVKIDIRSVKLEEVDISPQMIEYTLAVSYKKDDKEDFLEIKKSYNSFSTFLQLLRHEATLQQLVIPNDPYRPAIEELQEYHQKIAGQFMGKKKQRLVTAEFSRMHSDEQSKARLSLNYILHRLVTNKEIRQSAAMKAFFLDYDLNTIEFEHWNLNRPVAGPRISSSFSAKIEEVVFDKDDLWYKIAVTEQGETVHHIYRQYFELEFLHDQLTDQSQDRGQLPKSFPQGLLHLHNQLVNDSKARVIKESMPVPNIYVWLRQNSVTRRKFEEIEQKLHTHIQELNGFLYLLTFPMAKDDMEFHFFDLKNIDKTEEHVVADIPQDDSLNIAVKCCEETNEYCIYAITAGAEPKATYHTYEQLKQLHSIICSKWFYKDREFPDCPSNDADEIASYLKSLFADCILTWDDHLRFALGLTENEPAEVPPEPLCDNLDEDSPVKEVNIDEKVAEKFVEQVDGLDIIITANVSCPKLRNGKLCTTIEVTVGSTEPFYVQRHHGEFEQLHSYLTQSLKYQVEGFYIPKLPDLSDLFELMEALYQISNYYGGVDTLARRREEQDLQTSVQEKLIEAAEGYNQFLAELLEDFYLCDDRDVLEFLYMDLEQIYPKNEVIRRFQDPIVQNIKRGDAKKTLQTNIINTIN